MKDSAGTDSVPAYRTCSSSSSCNMQQQQQRVPLNMSRAEHAVNGVDNCHKHAAAAVSSVSSSTSDCDSPGMEGKRQPSYLAISCSVSGYGQHSNYGQCGDPTRSPGCRDPCVTPLAPHHVSGCSPVTAANGCCLTTPTEHSNGHHNQSQPASVTDTTNDRKQDDMRQNDGRQNDVRQEDGSRSFVQNRIERLYGPGALCSGFRRMDRSRNNSGTPRRTNETSTCVASASSLADDADEDKDITSPPVFRHLRAEFRQQLSLACRRGSPPALPCRTVVPTPSCVSSVVTAARCSDSCVTASSDTPPQAGSHVINNTTTSASTPAADVNTSDLSPALRFLQTLSHEEARLLLLASRAGADLQASSSHELSGEIEGKFRAAEGKARLLVAQKFRQFRGLCEKNINQPRDDPFPTTVDDLAGFWDMMVIQVQHIDQLMQELDCIRNNNWCLPQKSSPVPKSSSSKSTAPASATTRPRARRSATNNNNNNNNNNVGNVSAASVKSTVDRKHLAEQRRKLIENKRRALLQQQQQQQQQQLDNNNSSGIVCDVESHDQPVIIFTPAPSPATNNNNNNNNAPHPHN